MLSKCSRYTVQGNRPTCSQANDSMARYCTESIYQAENRGGAVQEPIISHCEGKLQVCSLVMYLYQLQRLFNQAKNLTKKVCQGVEKTGSSLQYCSLYHAYMYSSMNKLLSSNVKFLQEQTTSVYFFTLYVTSMKL